MSGLLDHHRRRMLWTDFGRERYYRILAENCERRLNALRNSPDATPDQLAMEQIELQGARSELRKIRKQKNIL